MKSYLTEDFITCFGKLPDTIKQRARKNYFGKKITLTQAFVSNEFIQKSYKSICIFAKIRGRIFAGISYHIVFTNVEASMIGSFVINGKFNDKAVPAINLSCSSGISLILATFLNSEKESGYSLKLGYCFK